MEIAIGICCAVVSVVSAGIAWYQAKVTDKAVKQAAVSNLFSTFQTANQATLHKPQLLYSVHGLDENIPLDEAASIAYLSVILDGFQQFYGSEFNYDYARMAQSLKKSTTFLNRILQVPDNQSRWIHVKKHYFGELDRAFIKAIDDLIDFEKLKQGERRTDRVSNTQ